MSRRVPSKLARYVRRYLRNMGGEDIQDAGNIDSDSVSTEEVGITDVTITYDTQLGSLVVINNE